MAKKYLNINTGKMTSCLALDKSKCYNHMHPERITGAIVAGGGAVPKGVDNPYTEKRMKTPPYMLELNRDKDSATFADENGNVYVKQYDENGSAGSMPLGLVGRLIYGRKIRQGSAKAWDEYAKDLEVKAANRQKVIDRINQSKNKE